jgi:hypothetical protein
MVIIEEINLAASRPTIRAIELTWMSTVAFSIAANWLAIALKEPDGVANGDFDGFSASVPRNPVRA